MLDTHEVRGSNPRAPTNKPNKIIDIRKPLPKHKEPFLKTGLEIVGPHIGKNFIVAYSSFSTLKIKTYNRAIRCVLKENGLDIFHQTDVPTLSHTDKNFSSLF